MIQAIYLYGSEVLRKTAEPMPLDARDEIAALVADLKDTLKASEGCGLAAPQIGVSRRVLIVDGSEVADQYPYLKDFRRTLINPELLWESDNRIEFAEGCLSIPGVYCDVRRPAAIRVAYYNEELERVEEDFEGFACRMIQHEMSHLDGELFTDLAAPIRRKMIAGKLKGIAKGAVTPRYNAKIK
jgi:peptide deformylase